VSRSPSQSLAGTVDIAYSTLRELRGSTAQKRGESNAQALVRQGSWNANSGKCGNLGNARRFAKQHTSERERGSTAMTRERVGAVLVFHGVLAPHAAWRSAVIPGRPEAEAGRTQHSFSAFHSFSIFPRPDGSGPRDSSASRL
jgi:hypothetical protein